MADQHLADWVFAHRAAMAACDAADLCRRSGLYAAEVEALALALRVENEARRRYVGGAKGRLMLAGSAGAIWGNLRDARRRLRGAHR